VVFLLNILWLCTAIRDHRLPNTTIQVNQHVTTHCTIALNRALKASLIASITFRKIEMLPTDRALLFSQMVKDVPQMFSRVKGETGMKVKFVVFCHMFDANC
jgi:hypothetical protein